MRAQGQGKAKLQERKQAALVLQILRSEEALLCYTWLITSETCPAAPALALKTTTSRGWAQRSLLKFLAISQWRRQIFEYSSLSHRERHIDTERYTPASFTASQFTFPTPPSIFPSLPRLNTSSFPPIFFSGKLTGTISRRSVQPQHVCIMQRVGRKPLWLIDPGWFFPPSWFFMITFDFSFPTQSCSLGVQLQILASQKAAENKKALPLPRMIRAKTWNVMTKAGQATDRKAYIFPKVYSCWRHWYPPGCLPHNAVYFKSNWKEKSRMSTK